MARCARACQRRGHFAGNVPGLAHSAGQHRPLAIQNLPHCSHKPVIHRRAHLADGGGLSRNHLPGGLDLETFGRPLYAESPFRGVGFGLGFAVVIDPVPGKVIGSAGELSWGGAASTAFWIDQAADLTVSFFTQLLPSSTYPIRPQLRQLVYQALTD